MAIMIAYFQDECGDETTVEFNSNETTIEELKDEYPEWRYSHFNEKNCGYSKWRELELLDQLDLY
jgi:molybdopterin converting factor small subunit